MRKTSILYVAVLMLLSAGVFAQAFEQGTSVISLGYGIGNLNKTLFSTYESEAGYDYTGVGPFFGKFEYGVSDRVGIGLNVAHVGVNVRYNEEYNGETYNYRVNWRNTSILGRVNIHFANTEKLDAFWGAGIGYRFGAWSYEDNNPDDSSENKIGALNPLGFETTIGVRYFFLENIGVYAEAGIAKAPLQFGVNVRF
ncbi:hypothetical protein SAMN05421823_101385 [Catalinimonas alkaloidigena]|uniref:Uncharacterized protein n=1 Tax=Catalinimonas alkaloidigena TaxID=1075417 RepID=A0A1G8XLH6_9BACT|nr:outer membrane beta-barrel protein [Catalinimonas alkaloidigena]SDJ90630.1 hypothetical protein SAMN05421823_101385 [Catalinimonas alkaloidigena]